MSPYNSAFGGGCCVCWWSFCLFCVVLSYVKLKVLVLAPDAHFFVFICCASSVSHELSPDAEQYTLYPGDHLVLRCPAVEEEEEVGGAVAVMTSAVGWTKDQVTIHDGDHTLLRNGRLEIEGVEPADSGMYGCLAVGPWGNGSALFAVNISGTFVGVHLIYSRSMDVRLVVGLF